MLRHGYVTVGAIVTEVMETLWAGRSEFDSHEGCYWIFPFKFSRA